MSSGSHPEPYGEAPLLLRVFFYLPAIIVLGVLVGILFMGYTEGFDD
jgi:hypothetical protein